MVNRSARWPVGGAFTPPIANNGRKPATPEAMDVGTQVRGNNGEDRSGALGRRYEWVVL